MQPFNSCLRMRKVITVLALAAATLTLVITMQNCSGAIESGSSVAQSNGNGGSYGGGNWLGFACEGPVKIGGGVLRVSLSKNTSDGIQLEVFQSQPNSTTIYPVETVTNIGTQARYAGSGILVAVDYSTKTGFVELQENGTIETFALNCQ